MPTPQTSTPAWARTDGPRSVGTDTAYPGGAEQPASVWAAADAAAPAPEPTPGTGSAPALPPPRWSGKKTAVAAALAIGLSSMGAVAAAATVPQGTDGLDARSGVGHPGGFPRGQLPGRGGMRGPGQGQVGPQSPGPGLAPGDPTAANGASGTT